MSVATNAADQANEAMDAANAAHSMATKTKNLTGYMGCHVVSYKSTVLDIDTAKDEITVNACKIYGRSGVFDVPQQTVKRNTESAISYLVYDPGVSDTAQRVKSIKYGTMAENHILMAILCGGTGGYEGSSNANYIPGRWSVDGVVYPEAVGMSEVEQRLGALEAKGDSAGFPLRWYALGDSITRGMYGYTGGSGVDTVNCWAALAAGYNGWTLTNKGVSGSGYVAKGGSDPETNAKEQVDATDFSGAELVTLAYGVNDWLQDNGVGSMDDDVTTGGTFISNMRYCIEKILSDNMEAKIVVVSPINCRSGCTVATNWGIGKANGAGATLEDFYLAEKTVCEYYGIEFIDMLHSSVVNRRNIYNALPDSVHPTKGIHKQMARELSRKIMG